MFCLRAQIWCDMICGRRLQMLLADIYLFVRKFIRVESLQCIIGDRAVETRKGQFIGNDSVQI